MSCAITPIEELGVLHIGGADALDFLHRQLSNDFALLKHDQARLCTLLTPKGRMLASFIGVRWGAQDVLLLVHQSVLAAVQKRLGMFVLRAKVKIADASAQWRLRGLIGEEAIAKAAALPVWGDAAAKPARPLAPWQTIASAAAAVADSDTGAAWLIGLYPADGLPRALAISAASDADALPPDADAAFWAWSEAASGVSTISQGVVDQFVPQMLNYESVGGVNFKKGCYPGQEVVARSQFRGAIKRRAYLAQGTASALPAAGTEVFSASDPDQPSGQIVQAAWVRQPGQPAPASPDDASGAAFAAIVSIKIAHAGETLRAGQGEDAIDLQIAPAPYPILEDI